MAIPKYILHPFLLILSGLIILWLVWSHVPSGEELKEKAAAPATALPQTLPDPAKLAKIDSFQNGNLVTTDGREFELADARFQNLSQEESGKMSAFFAGKFFDPEKTAAGVTLHLPIELYDPLCFKPADTAPVHCPIVLQK